MAPKILVQITVLLTVVIVLCSAGGKSSHTRFIIHVPLKIKTHHHTHTIIKHIHHGGGGVEYKVLGYSGGHGHIGHGHGGGSGYGGSGHGGSGYGGSGYGSSGHGSSGHGISSPGLLGAIGHSAIIGHNEIADSSGYGHSGGGWD